MLSPIELTIIPPTYNESENVEILFKEIVQAMKYTKRKYEVLFVDDSDDETPHIIHKMMEKNKNIRLIHRDKKERTGLATAFTEGFKEARGKYICCMDADLQHSPLRIPVMLEQIIADDADIVIASRYTKGGNADGLGSWYRKIVSLGVRYFVHSIFPITRTTTDPGSGFFLFKKEILNGVTLQPQGFKILIEMLVATQCQKVTQVPNIQLLRRYNTSKASLGEGIKFLKHMWKIFQTIPMAGRFMRFCIGLASGVFLSFITLYSLMEMLLFPKSFSWMFAFFVFIMNAFLWNFFYIYKDEAEKMYKEKLQRIFMYYLLFIFISFFYYKIFFEMFFSEISFALSFFLSFIFMGSVNFLLTKKFFEKKAIPFKGMKI